MKKLFGMTQEELKVFIAEQCRAPTRSVKVVTRTNGQLVLEIEHIGGWIEVIPVPPEPATEPE